MKLAGFLLAATLASVVAFDFIPLSPGPEIPITNNDRLGDEFPWDSHNMVSKRQEELNFDPDLQGLLRRVPERMEMNWSKRKPQRLQIKIKKPFDRENLYS